MEQRVSLVTLGVDDLDRSRRFYEALGWEPSPASLDELVLFRLPCLVLALWDRAALAEDTGVAHGGFGGIVLAHNVRSPEEVDAVVAAARAAGARVTREPGPTEWGGYSAVFLDPDGHPWELAHNPGWPLDTDGAPQLPG